MSGHDYMLLRHAFESTKGYMVWELLDTMNVSLNIFWGNEEELKQKLQQHASPSSLKEFGGVDNREKLQEEFYEIIRLLHNYVASAKSLVDHTRRVAKKLLQDKHLDTYQERIDLDFKEDPLAKFLHDLRNYLLHVSNPPVNRTTHFTPTHIKSVGIELEVKVLLEWDGWTKRSRDFLQGHEDNIDLTGVVAEYRGKLDAFYHWFCDHIEMACKLDLDELWAKHDEWASFCKKHGIPTTDDEFRRYSRSEHE